MIVPRAAEVYYNKYAQLIFSESFGRGSYFKKFYKYLFDHTDLLEEALNTGMLFQIPVDSLNFSNFIHCLYYVVQSKGISYELFDKIKNTFLKHVKIEIINDRDESVLHALLLL